MADSDSKPRSALPLRHAVVYGLGTIAVQAASFVLLPLYTRRLSQADFGVLEVLSRSGEMLMIVLMSSGLSMATFSFYCQAKSREERERVAATVTTALWIVLGIGAAMVALLARPLGLALKLDQTWLVALFLGAAILDATTMVPVSLAQARIESVYYVSIALATAVCRVVLTVVFVAGLGWGLWGVLAGWAANSLVFTVLLNVREFAGRAFRPDPKLLREILAFSLPFIPGSICFFVLNNGDRYFLLPLAGKEAVGVYSLAYKLALIAGVLAYSPLQKVWSAGMFHAFAEKDAAAVVGRTVSWILGAYLLAGLGLCIFAREAILVLATPSYVTAIPLVAPVVLAYFFANLANLADGPFYVYRRTYLKPWILAASAAVMTALYAVLIPRYGSTGAAYATLSGFAFHAAVTIAVSQRVFRVRYEPGRLTLMTALAVGLVVAARQLDASLMLVPARIALWLAWPAALWTAGVIRPDEKAEVAARVRRLMEIVRRSLAPRPGSTSDELSASGVSAVPSEAADEAVSPFVEPVVVDDGDGGR